MFNRHLKSHIWKQNLISDFSLHPTCFLFVLTCSAVMWLFNTLGKTLETMLPTFFLPLFTFSSPDGWLCLQNNACLYNTGQILLISSTILWDSLSDCIELIELGFCSLWFHLLAILLCPGLTPLSETPFQKLYLISIDSCFKYSKGSWSHRRKPKDHSPQGTARSGPWFWLCLHFPLFLWPCSPPGHVILLILLPLAFPITGLLA